MTLNFVKNQLEKDNISYEIKEHYSHNVISFKVNIYHLHLVYDEDKNITGFLSSCRSNECATAITYFMKQLKYKSQL